jgi:hypothetical protein
MKKTLNKKTNIGYLEIGFADFHMNDSEHSASKLDLEFWGEVKNITETMRAEMDKNGFNCINDLPRDFVVFKQVENLDVMEVSERASKERALLREIMG